MLASVSAVVRRQQNKTSQTVSGTRRVEVRAVFPNGLPFGLFFRLLVKCHGLGSRRLYARTSALFEEDGGDDGSSSAARSSVLLEVERIEQPARFYCAEQMSQDDIDSSLEEAHLHLIGSGPAAAQMVRSILSELRELCAFFSGVYCRLLVPCTHCLVLGNDPPFFQDRDSVELLLRTSGQGMAACPLQRDPEGKLENQYRGTTLLEEARKAAGYVLDHPDEFVVGAAALKALRDDMKTVQKLQLNARSDFESVLLSSEGPAQWTVVAMMVPCFTASATAATAVAAATVANTKQEEGRDAEKGGEDVDDDVFQVQDSKRKDVFISYSHRNSEFVQLLAGDLARAGLSVWLDTSGIRGGYKVCILCVDRLRLGGASGGIVQGHCGRD